MEHIEFALPEDTCKMSEELNVKSLDLLISLSLSDLAHQLIDVVTGLVSVSPLAHLNCELNLLLSDLKDFCNLIWLLQLDREGNLCVLVWILIRLYNLVEVRVKCLRNNFVLLRRFVLSAIIEDNSCGFIVKFEKLTV